MYSLLIADDFRIDRENAAQSVDWGELGIELVAQVENGAQALEYLRRAPVDFVLTDVEMPRMDGITLAQEIRRAGWDISVAFMSNHSEVDYLKSAIDLRAASYIIKPVESEGIAGLFRTLIAQKEERRRMARIVEEGRPLLISQFLHRLCNGLYLSEEDAADFARLVLGAGWNHRVLLPVVIGMADDFKPGGTMQQLDLSWRIRMLCEEQGACLNGLLDDSCCVVLLAGDSQEAVRSAAQRMAVSLEEAVSDSGWVVCGEICDGLQRVSQAYLAAREMLRLKQLGSSIPLESDSGRMQGRLDPGLILKQVRFYLVNKEKEKLDAFVDDIANEIAGMESPGMVACVLDSVVIAVNAALCEAGLTIDSVRHVPELLWTCGTAQNSTVAEMKACMAELLNASLSALQTVRGSGASKIVSDVIMYIDRNIAQEITVGKIAGELYFSSNYLNLIFKHDTGRTIREYLQYARMEKAKELLRKRTIPVKEVMRMVGYKKASYFNKVFKEAVGMTPSQFRGLK